MQKYSDVDYVVIDLLKEQNGGGLDEDFLYVCFENVCTVTGTKVDRGFFQNILSFLQTQGYIKREKNKLIISDEHYIKLLQKQLQKHDNKLAYNLCRTFFLSYPDLDFDVLINKAIQNDIITLSNDKNIIYGKVVDNATKKVKPITDSQLPLFEENTIFEDDNVKTEDTEDAEDKAMKESRVHTVKSKDGSHSYIWLDISVDAKRVIKACYKYNISPSNKSDPRFLASDIKRICRENSLRTSRFKEGLEELISKGLIKPIGKLNSPVSYSLVRRSLYDSFVLVSKKYNIKENAVSLMSSYEFLASQGDAAINEHPLTVLGINREELHLKLALYMKEFFGVTNILHILR